MHDSHKSYFAVLLASATLVGLGVGGCAHKNISSAGAGAPAAPISSNDPDRLIDFYANPKAVSRDYQELNLITVLAWGRTQEEQIAELKERARAAGADAVILFDQSMTNEPSLNYSDSTCQTDSIQMRGMAIVYDADADDDVRTPAGR